MNDPSVEKIFCFSIFTFISQPVVQNLDDWRLCRSYLPQVQTTHLFLFRFVSSSQCFLVIFVFVLVCYCDNWSFSFKRSAQICSIIFIGFVVFCIVYCSNPYIIFSCLPPVQLLEADVVNSSEEGLDVALLPSGAPAFLPVPHLSDHVSNCKALLSVYKPSTRLTSVVCYGRNKRQEIVS